MKFGIFRVGSFCALVGCMAFGHVGTASAVSTVGTLDDRSPSTNYTTSGNWQVYALKAGEKSSRSGDGTSARIERRLLSVKRSGSTRRVFEGTYRIRKAASGSNGTVIAQVHVAPKKFHGNVILIYVKDDGSHWKILNDEYRSSDGKRSKVRQLARIGKNSNLRLKLSTGFNSSNTASNTKITINGSFKGTTKHFHRGDSATIRYGAYRTGSKSGSDTRILVQSTKTFTEKK